MKSLMFPLKLSLHVLIFVKHYFAMHLDLENFCSPMHTKRLNDITVAFGEVGI